MTEPISATEVPDDIGRNEPCPCGSGQKYKKCCMRTHRVQKEAKKSARKPEQLIGEHTKPWRMFKLLVQMRENNMPNLLWEAGHPLGPWRTKYPTREAFFEALGSGADNMPAREGFDLARIRHDGPDVLLLLARGLRDSHLTTAQCEVITLRPNELDEQREPRSTEFWGYRVWNVETHEAKKHDGDADVTFEALGYQWAPEWEHTQQANVSPANLAAPLATSVFEDDDEVAGGEEE